MVDRRRRQRRSFWQECNRREQRRNKEAAPLRRPLYVAAFRLWGRNQYAETISLEGNVGLHCIGVGVDDAHVLVVRRGNVDLAGGRAAGGGDGVGVTEDHIGSAIGGSRSGSTGESSDGGRNLIGLKVDDGDRAKAGVG